VWGRKKKCKWSVLLKRSGIPLLCCVPEGDKEELGEVEDLPSLALPYKGRERTNTPSFNIGPLTKNL